MANLKLSVTGPLTHWPTDSPNYKEMLSHLKTVNEGNLGGEQQRICDPAHLRCHHLLVGKRALYDVYDQLHCDARKIFCCELPHFWLKEWAQGSFCVEAHFPPGFNWTTFRSHWSW